MKCTLCPRACGIDRTVAQGFCHAGREPEIAAVCAHLGEEPPISGRKGICNVFFTHCNLQCIYCQNWQISTHSSVSRADSSPNLGEQLKIDQIAAVLEETENILGFVTPTHYADRIPAMVEELHRRGLHPVTVYNTSGYETVETLRMLEPYIDVYLPDFKYADADLAARYSHAPDYPERALAALEEMYRQKGSVLITDEDGLAVRGIIVRHLVLPGCVENSLGVLDRIADISMNLHVSLMAQYYPPTMVGDLVEPTGVHRSTPLPDQLSRNVTAEEYDTVVEHFHATGLHNGWLQELTSEKNYRPDFLSDIIFKQSDEQ